MFQYIKDRMKNIVVSLRVSILSIFVLIFILIMVTLIAIYRNNINNIVLRGALLLMDKTSYSVLYDLDLKLRPAQDISLLGSAQIKEKVLDINSESEMLNFMTEVLAKMPIVEGIYWADTEGDFIYAAREPNNSGFLMQFINRRVIPPTTTYLSVDKTHQVTQRTITNEVIDPRQRPWFQLAVTKRATAWTDAYIFQPQSVFGVTVATPTFQSNGELLGVLGLDIRLDYLSQYLSKEKVGNTGEIFLLDRVGNIIASSTNVERSALKMNQLANVNNVSRAGLAKAFALYQRSHENNFRFVLGGEKYLATFIPISLLKGNDWVIAVIDVASDFTSKIHQIQLVYILIFFIIFAIGLMLVSHLVTRVITPIKKLLQETERIKNFNLESSERVRSRIKEVIDLSNAIYSMKTGLRSFQKYVPASLVRQLIRSGEGAHIGGSKRKLVIFFSDIQDFTAIAEKSDSNRLVKQVCDYLETLTHVITQNKGTIDKYIGDSIMAFWGAPIGVHDPCQAAARAAIRCMQFTQVLNTDWKAKDRPLFITHIGLHFGEAIVGSLGSSERLNYTVLGDAVNTASRLVNANKIYGTYILVTESIYSQIKKTFVLRLVDNVTFKGKAESILLYELLAEVRQSVPFDVDAYNQEFERGFDAYQAQKWKAAIAHFKICLTIYPQDTLAPVFIARCEHFIAEPPVDWDGVWHISEK